ncbi:MAG: glycine--tRNA ligase subunit beta [Rhodocyclaceae bacterium]|jgi:glycyl-tRNA synthetase beta chain|nr:glycine--tRNA ligase subunit beta [Rhodocyclaceae bacterium]
MSQAKTPVTASLLVELLTEELPPKALARFGEVFSAGVFAGLVQKKLVAENVAYQWFATPRRLAVLIPHVLSLAPDQEVEEKLMPVSVALGADGQPSPALLKKLESKGIAASELPKFTKRMDGKSETFFYTMAVTGAQLADVLSGIVGDALKKLPIPKVMRWGDSDVQFVRPVHGLIQLHGDQLIPGEVLGLQSRQQTLGHRFLSRGLITIPDADAYAETLRREGKVVADYSERRGTIGANLAAQAQALGAQINQADGLLDEVTALVEWPVIYVGEFEPEFLEVPQECLILTMQQNQKYFPLLDNTGKLRNQFLIVSNMQVADPRHIIGGNQRVVRPRLSDARFFFTQDRKEPLASRIAKLGNVVYHNKLGTQLDRLLRVQNLATQIGHAISADTTHVARAAELAKADLVTDMVGEFPELQGIMGRYYAQHDGEAADVAEAIADHYRPRFAGDALPSNNVGCAVALADKLDTLVGFFGIGEKPTGDRDPFGLRRAALGVLRLLMERQLPLELPQLIQWSAGTFPAGVLQPDFEPALLAFITDRLRNLLKDQGEPQDVVEAVLGLNPARIDRVPARLAAVREFTAQPDALALAAANKRIGNLLKKVDDVSTLGAPNSTLLTEAPEKALYDKVTALAPTIADAMQAEAYADALMALAQVRASVDAFFEDVMVMAEDAKIRQNRLALLKTLSDQMNAVADIARLAV